MKRKAWAPITPALATSASAGASVAMALLWATAILGVSSVLNGSPLERQVLTLVVGGWLRRSA